MIGPQLPQKVKYKSDIKRLKPQCLFQVQLSKKDIRDSSTQLLKGEVGKPFTLPWPVFIAFQH